MKNFGKTINIKKDMHFMWLCKIGLYAIYKVWSNFEKPNKNNFGCGNGVLTYLLKCSGFGKNILGVMLAKGISYASKFFSGKDLNFKTMENLIHQQMRNLI